MGKKNRNPQNKGTPYADNNYAFGPSGNNGSKKKNNNNQNQNQNGKNRQNRQTYSGTRPYEAVKLDKRWHGGLKQTTEEIELAKINQKANIEKTRGRTASVIGASGAASSAASSMRASDPVVRQYEELADGGLGPGTGGEGENKPNSQNKNSNAPTNVMGTFE